MKVRKLSVGALGTNCYVVWDEETKTGIVIDPGDEGRRITDACSDLGIRVSHIVLTHGHFDHTGACSFVRAKTGASIVIGERDAHLLEDPGWMAGLAATLPREDLAGVTRVSEGDVIEVGREALRVLHTPGHTEGSICLFAPGLLFSGDLIFKGGVGRTDLPGGDEMALSSSIATKVLTLPDDTRIYPGHGPDTTVGAEKTQNPFL